MNKSASLSAIDNLFKGLTFRIQHKSDDMFNVIAVFNGRSSINSFHSGDHERIAKWEFITPSKVKIVITAFNMSLFKITKI